VDEVLRVDVLNTADLEKRGEQGWPLHRLDSFTLRF
jgi:hypothetical protein